MANLNFLYNQEVMAYIDIDENEPLKIEGRIIDVNVNDFYFYEKGEPVYITVNIEPLGDVPEDIDYEYFINIPLNNIYKL
ncbi:hypothetical protein [Flavobacterium sp.]|uniref:hypothetical protein n=1 Tax=Flavobacterium sp. TaxID=239 RepID=UPI002616E486|nr:hypothetical protein [Flavobacterium sp.]